jgi:hypothetical protein
MGELIYSEIRPPVNNCNCYTLSGKLVVEIIIIESIQRGFKEGT